MATLLIRDVPDDVVARIDTQAAREGLSRAEYLRRQLVSDARRHGSTVTAADLGRSDALLDDLLDERLMDDAWR
ncbi:antitoxin [Herbiconiux moechotypicola]|uniref:Type II toxin-antitoxin system antitoxin VapB2 n=1 Tax=Herbiconiux moechotypicola TaxID=637393 RepID=A0ABN3D726_9MICO|nr:antitoxin [Herbiconiux moechotypicola]MCS5728630.1 antitoxin [Herbiconiux moechotypicola]